MKDEYEESLHEKKREKRLRDENVDREKDLYVSLYSFFIYEIKSIYKLSFECHKILIL